MKKIILAVALLCSFTSAMAQWDGVPTPYKPTITCTASGNGQVVCY